MSTDTLEFPPLAAPTPAAVTVASIKEAALAPLVAAETQIRALAKRHDKVAFAVATKDGMAQAKAARNELREQGRFLVQRARDKFKADANDAKREVEAFCDRLIEVIKPVEDAVDGQIKAEEQLQAEKKARREREEEARKERHRTGIAAIRIYVERASQPGMTAERIACGIAQLEAVPTPTTEQWEDFAVPAADAICQTLEAMRRLHAKAMADEEDARQREAQRVENERAAAELAEQRRWIAEQRAIAERERAEAAAEVARLREQVAAERAELKEARKVTEARNEPKGIAGAACRPETVKETAQAGAAHNGAGDDAKHDGRPAIPGGLDTPQGGGAQHVLKAEPARCTLPADATDREPHAASASPSVGSMGTGQAADAAPAAGPITMIEPTAPANNLPPFNLGKWERRMGFPLKRIFIEEDLGIPHSHTEKASVLWSGSDFQRICDALVAYILARAQA